MPEIFCYGLYCRSHKMFEMKYTTISLDAHLKNLLKHLHKLLDIELFMHDSCSRHYGLFTSKQEKQGKVKPNSTAQPWQNRGRKNWFLSWLILDFKGWKGSYCPKTESGDGIFNQVFIIYQTFFKNSIMLHMKNQSSLDIRKKAEQDISHLYPFSTIIWHSFMSKSFFVGVCGIQVRGCKTLGSLRPRRFILRAQAADLATGVSATGPETTLYHWRLNYIPVWLWFYHQYPMPRYLGVVTPTCAL